MGTGLASRAGTGLACVACLAWWFVEWEWEWVGPCVVSLFWRPAFQRAWGSRALGWLVLVLALTLGGWTAVRVYDKHQASVERLVGSGMRLSSEPYAFLVLHWLFGHAGRCMSNIEDASRSAVLVPRRSARLSLSPLHTARTCSILFIIAFLKRTQTCIYIPILAKAQLCKSSTSDSS